MSAKTVIIELTPEQGLEIVKALHQERKALNPVGQERQIHYLGNLIGLFMVNPDMQDILESGGFDDER